MRSAEIRQRWFKHFEKHNHHIAPSVSLVSPDPSILFTIAGMVPFIPYIIGTEPAPWPRVASVQKCLRTNDIDNVGRTTRHGTFFQMCGNFSFGDYFKEGAIQYAWELLTNPISQGGYGLDGDRIWVTIWNEDKVTYDTWTNTIGIDPKHVVQLTREEIFWSTGQPGPAGPCAEIHYDRGAKYGPEAVGGTVDPGGDRYLEIWNLVFDEFLRGEGQGKNYPLLGNIKQTAIDTGAGLERIAYLLQGKENMYEIDEVWPLISTTEQITNKTYGKNAEDDVRMRVIADHIRSSLMIIADGVRPGNDGRGYVLRRLLRRAVRSMRILGVDETTLPTLLPVSKDAMKDSYPELDINFSQISAVAYEEEAAFRRTLSAGTTILDTAVSKAKKASAANKNCKTVLSGKDAFTLHDTYGFPIDLTLEMAAEQGVEVDTESFKAYMQEQKDRARADAQAKKTGHVDASLYKDIMAKTREGQGSLFLGYTDYQAEGQIIALLQNGESKTIINAPAEVDVILDKTPFWAEQGGQLADKGTITVVDNGVLQVDDVQMPIKGLFVHKCRLLTGQVAVNDKVISEIDVLRRGQIARAHTATHMIHKALHEFIGQQATQAGSENSPSRLRFDFRHGSSIPSEVMTEIEQRVNQRLQENITVTDQIMDIEDAKAAGAMALFGEKYGQKVRVVSIGSDWSKELCAGTHVTSTGQIGLVSLIGESSIGSGVRRIEALVGEGAWAKGAKERALLAAISNVLGAREDEILSRLDTVLTKLKTSEKELALLRSAQLLAKSDSLLANTKDCGKVRLLSANLGEVNSADDLRNLVTHLREKLGNAPAVVALFGNVNERPMVTVATSAQARELGIKAGALVKLAATALGGGGGGRDDLAQGGGQNLYSIPQALQIIEQSVKEV